MSDGLWFAGDGRRAGAWVLGAGLLVAATTPAMAQDFSFDLNSVLVASFEADQPFLEPEAERVRSLVEASLGDAYVVVRMSEVPPFTDYSADVYLRSCPDGQYIGCVFVVGGRAETDWTIGGRVGAVEGGYRVDLSFVNVAEAKLVLEFDVVLDGSNDNEFKEGVVRIMDALVNGEVQELDLRGDQEAQRAAEAEKAERERRAREMAAESVYEDLEQDPFERGGTGDSGYGRGDRIGDEDLEAMESQGQLPPWERVGLTKAQYKMYRNSGKKLRDFKAKLQGYKGEILIRVSGNISSGAWSQNMEQFSVVENETNLSNIRQADVIGQYFDLYQGRGLAPGGMLELGYGVLPFMDISLFAGVKAAPYNFRVYTELKDQLDPVLAPPEARSSSTFHFGLSLGFAMGPAWPVRPSLRIGASYWLGTAPSGVANLSPALLAAYAPGNNLVLAHAQPGLDIPIGKVAVLFARFDLDVPIAPISRVSNQATAGAFRQLQNSPPYLANNPPEGTVLPYTGVGLGGSVGITFRIRVAGLR